MNLGIEYFVSFLMLYGVVRLVMDVASLLFRIVGKNE